jgi:hypothetical protein
MGSDRQKAVLHHIRMHARKQPFAASGKLARMTTPHRWMCALVVFLLVGPALALAQQQPESGSSIPSPARIESISGRACKGGSHVQPQGPFGVYVFCDDALGTNIAVFYPQLGDPRFEKWTLTRRFWQGGPWSADVGALGWVPGRNLLVVSTSAIYGTGGVYLLDLEKQTYTKLGSTSDCESSVAALSESSVTVALDNCENPRPSKKIKLAFPHDPAK